MKAIAALAAGLVLAPLVAAHPGLEAVVCLAVVPQCLPGEWEVLEFSQVFGKLA